MAKPSERAAEMRKLLQEYSTSGQTRRQFCAKQNLPLSTFDYWRQQLRTKPRLVKVEVAQPEVASHGFTLRLANGRSIESSWRFDQEELTRLIRIAELA
jgi:hypothetical protein